MKRITKIYSYGPASGLEAHKISYQRHGSLVRETGISGEVIRESELDVPGARYFTTKRAAVAAFIVKAHSALDDASKSESTRAEWKEALDAAYVVLEQHPVAASPRKPVARKR